MAAAAALALWELLLHSVDGGRDDAEATAMTAVTAKPMPRQSMEEARDVLLLAKTPACATMMAKTATSLR